MKVMSSVYPLFVRWLCAAVMAYGASGVRATTPFNPNILPGLPATLECEQFDNGPAVAYSAAAGYNIGGKFRPDNVSIYRCDGVLSGPGYCIGDTWPGDWFQYSVTNCESATYWVKVRAAINPGAGTATVFHLAVDGVNVTGGMTLPYNPYTWQTVVGSGYIAAGAHALQLVIESGDSTYGAGFFDYITIHKTPPTIVNPTHPITVNNLQTGYNLAIAKANAVRLQAALNTLPATGGTVTLVGSGPYYFCQPNPIESFRNPNGRGQINTPAVADVGATGNLRSDAEPRASVVECGPDASRRVGTALAQGLELHARWPTGRHLDERPPRRDAPRIPWHFHAGRYGAHRFSSRGETI